MVSRITTLAVLAAATLSVACKKSDQTPADTAAAAPSAMAPAAATAPGSTATATAAAPALTDANIAWILDQANAADSARGTLAETKGTSSDVKNFAKLMVGEHHALRAEGQALVKKLGVTPVAPAGSDAEAQTKQEMDSLTAMPKGAAWDKAYMDYEVTYHKALMGTATQALGAAQNAELKALIQKAAPVVQHHLDRAEAVQKKLGA